VPLLRDLGREARIQEQEEKIANCAGGLNAGLKAGTT
jgi:hypothetical protein